MYRVGDAVIYNGKTYYIIEGPIIGAEGSIYHISEVPPAIRVLERDISRAES